MKVVRYIIHQHDAVRAGLHLDLRFQQPNSNLIVSFAIPKAEIPQNIGDKVLAIKVEDHGQYFLNVDNMSIPKGQYGHGEMKMIQKGRMILEGFSPDYITFRMPEGKHMNGRFALIRFKKNDPKEKQQIYILTKIKEKDNDASPGNDKSIKK
jgi:hypothetical protein